MAAPNSNPEPRSPKSFSPKSTRQFPYQRRLKVRFGAYYYQYGDFQPHRHRCEPVPFVNLKGYWMRQASFRIGTWLQAEISEGRIVLTVASDSPRT